jgi:two-component system NtrC family sensor kinase
MPCSLSCRNWRTKEDIEYVFDDIQELVSESLAGTVRVKDIVAGLKSFSRVDDAQVADADLHSGIDATLKVVANELKYKCDIVKEYGELLFVPCNLAKLNQAFINLLVNAVQAIETSGTITLRTCIEGNFACVEVSDTDRSVSEDQIDSIFDSFFTTKLVGSGTGLGLSISYCIVQEHGGAINVRSEVCVGTTFVVKLPLKGEVKNTS